MAVKWSAFSSGSAIQDANEVVGLQSSSNVRWAWSAVKTYILGAANAVLAITAAKTVTHTATTTFAGTDGKTLTVSNSGTLGGGDAFVLAIAAGKTFTSSNTLTLTGTDATSFAFPNASGTVVTLDASQVLTNKTLTSPTLTGPALGTPISGVLSSCTAYPFASLTGSASVAQFGSTSYAVAVIFLTATGVDFNAVADTAITVTLPTGFTRYTVATVRIWGASGDISAAQFGVFTAAAGGGTAVVASGTAITVNTASADTNNNSMATGTINSNTLTYTLASVPTIYFRVTTGQGAARTASVGINIVPVN